MAPLTDTALLAALLIAALHWFPWARLFGGALPRLLAYAIGVGVILAVPSFVYLRIAPAAGETVLQMFWAAGLAAGAMTLAGWAIDGLIEGSARLADLEDAANERANRLD